jgi:hypothetical protein
MIRHKNAAQEYLAQFVNFGGVTCTLGEAIRQMQDEGHDQRAIDYWVMGATARASRLGNQDKPAGISEWA